MANEEDLAAQSLQQSQQQQHPVPKQLQQASVEAEDLGRDGQLRETLRGEGRFVRDAEYVAQLLENHPELLRRPRGVEPSGLNRLIDMKLPLWGVLGAIASLAMVLVTMWFNVNQLTTSMTDMQKIMRDYTTAVSANDRIIARMASEVETLQETIRDQRLRLDNMQNQLNNNSARLTLREERTPR